MESRINVRARPKSGLHAEVDAFVDEGEPYPKSEKALKRHDAYCARLSQRRVEEKWESSGIVEFFTADEKEFKIMLWGQPTKFVGEPGAYEEVECDYDDRDAMLGQW